MNRRKIVLISEGSLPWWKLVLIAGILTFMVYLMIIYSLNNSFSFSEKYFMGLIKSLELHIYLLGFAIYLSLTQNYLFDFSKKKFKKEISFLFLRFGRWKKLPELEYVSVFLNANKEIEVNFWYFKNIHFKIAVYYDYNDAIEAGFKIAYKMEIDLLDATKRGKSKWIDKLAYEETKSIKYLD